MMQATSPLLRVYVRVPLSYVDRVRQLFGENGQKQLLWDIDRRTQRLGFYPAFSVMQDPTDNSIVKVIARPATSSPKTTDGVASIVRIDNVEEPPEYVVDESLPQSVLESGLTRAEAQAVHHVLVHEDNPRHVDGFASTLEPFFPLSASLVRSKAMLLEARAFANREALIQAQTAVGQKLSQATEGPVKPSPTTTGEELAEILSRTTRGRWGDAQLKLKELSKVLPSSWYPTGPLSRSPLPTTEEELTQARNLALEEGGRIGLPKDVVEVEIKRVAAMICESPSLLLSLPQTDEQLKSFPPAVIRAGRSVVREVGPGIVVVDPDKLQLVSPPNWRDGFVSPSAFMAAQANAKPEMAMVARPRGVRQIFGDVAEGGLGSKDPTGNARARVQLEKAARMLERRRWIDWYHRRAKAYGG